VRRLFFACAIVAGCDRPVPPIPPPVAGSPAIERRAPPPPIPLPTRAQTALSGRDAAVLEAVEKELTEVLEQAIETDLLVLRGRVRERLGRDEAALADFAAALQRAGDRHELRRCRLALLEKHELWAELALDLDYLDDATLRLLRARARAKAGEAARAVEDYGVLIAASPEDPVLRSERAACAMEAGSYAMAFADSTYLVEHFPTAENYARRGGFRRRTNGTEKALEDFSRGLELDPKNVESLIGLAELLMKTDPKKAIALSSIALEQTTENPHAWFVRGVSRLYLKERDGGAEDLRRAMQLKPGLAEMGNHLLSLPYEQLLKERAKT
jgi:tetratricopeptide (TPR) repeat protein